MSSLTALFRASADRWQFPVSAAVLLNAAAILAVPALAALFFLHRGAFRLMLNEDRIVEWSQVALWAGCAIVGGWIARDRMRRGHRVQGFLWIGFVLASIVIIGEEISWGQRLLGLETPEALEEINEQEEINLHNIGRTLTVFNMTLFIASLYAIAAEWIERRWHYASRIADGARLYVPPFFLAGLFAVMALYRVVRSVIFNQQSYALTSLSEWAELSFIAALFISVLLSARWLASHPAEA